MKFIGITGGVGAGKSAVLDFLSKHYKCEIYLADDVANELKEPGRICYREIVDLLGQDVCGEDGRIDNQKMSARIFSDEQMLARVNAIIHPAVKVYLLDHLAEAMSRGDCELFFVEAALLIECGYKQLVDELWYVYADEATRRDRLQRTRGYSDAKIDSIMRSQLEEAEYRNQCDFVIDNSGDISDVHRQIVEKLEGYTWLA